MGVWQNDRTLIIHYGTVGETGETEEMKLPTIQRAEKVMDELAEEEDKLIEQVVQYSYKETEIQTVLKLRHTVEDLMNECLGWTLNSIKKNLINQKVDWW